MSQSSRWFSAIIILIASLVFSLPMLRDGLPFAHDTEEHLERYTCFAAQISEGEWYPRWLTNANAGLGSPVMFVYAPFAYYVPAALRPLLRFHPDGAQESREFGVSMWLAMAASGLAAFLWLGSFVKRIAVATFGAVLYMAMPYHFVVDFYTRDAVSEVWAFAWMPLILYFAYMTMRRKDAFPIAGLAVTYGLLILTHLLTTLIFTPVVIGAALFSIPKSGWRGALPRFSLALALGIGIGSIYLAPALQHEKDVSPERLAAFRPTLSYPRNFMSFSRQQTDSTSRGDYVWKVSWITISTAVAALAALVLRKRAALSPLDWFWAATGAVSLVLMFPISAPVWKNVPQLAALQFPYRFNTLLVIAALVLLVSAFDSLTRPVRVWRILVAAGIAGLMGLWGITDFRTVRQLKPGKLPSDPLMANRPLGLDVELPAWSQAKNPNFLRQTGVLELGNQVGRAVAPGISAERLTPRRIEITTSGSPGWTVLPILFYPAWSAQSETGSKLNLRAVTENGLAEVDVPPGVKHIELILPLGSMEKLGITAAAICGIFTLLLLVEGFRQRRRKAAAKTLQAVAGTAPAQC